MKNDSETGIQVTFDQLSRAEANRAAQELRRVIVDRIGDAITVSIEKDDPDSQDGGHTLILLFGTSAITAVVQAIRSYLDRCGGRNDSITIKTVDGTRIVANGDAARTLDATTILMAMKSTSIPRSRILFLAANPRDSTPLELGQECAAIQRELRMTTGRDDFEFCSKWAVTVDELGRHLMELSPTVIHFSGHGASVEEISEPSVSSYARRRDVGRADVDTAGCGIYLHDDLGGSQLVSARALAMMIKSTARSARVLVLNACYSSAQAECLRAVVDGVVGMTGAIDDRSARTFAVALYRALGNGRSVANAVEHAAATLAAKRLSPDVQLCVRTRDGIDADRIVLTTTDLPRVRC